ncbi:MAG: glycosyltransferase family 9 protein [Planctomycetota bacterium]
MSRILVIKTAALGDVLRTTSILPGLRTRHREATVTWLTAPAARPLIAHHADVHDVLVVDPRDEAAVAALATDLAKTPWQWVLSLDDEAPLCRLARALPCDRLSGALETAPGTLGYTDDVAPWFDMGLLSRLGKARADRLKVENTRSHPAIFATMLGLEEGRPQLPLPEAARLRAEAFARAHHLHDAGAVVGLNTGAGGRWRSKGLPVDRVVELAARLDAALSHRVTFLLLGGPEERERNAAIVRDVTALPSSVRLVDAGTDNPLLDFAALIDRCDLVVSSDSLALHMALARQRRVVAFFAPTSAAEIELWDLGEKVVSTAPDYCSYRPDADNSSLTAARIADACLRVLTRTG